jgi:hypothetical protein
MPLNLVRNVAAQASHAWPKQYVRCAMFASRPARNRPTAKVKTEENGARCRFRTYDPYRVKVMLYH